MSLLDSLEISPYILKKNMQVWRVVEDQSTSTTRKFVDSVEEHDLLENMIDNAKPDIKYYGDEKDFMGLHYLLTTPFRYPPLKWGSRFGSRFERSLLYASPQLETAFSEKAFYKFVFLQASDGDIGGKTVSYTAFNISIISHQFLDLCTAPFEQYQNEISSKTSYDFTQSLGKAMREYKIECFQYASARCPNKGKNVGIFTPRALKSNVDIASTFKYWNCYFTKTSIEFSRHHYEKHHRYIFTKDMFLVNNLVPAPSV